MQGFNIGDKVKKLDGTRFRDGAKILTVSKVLVVNREVFRQQVWFKETNTWLYSNDLAYAWPYDDREVI